MGARSSPSRSATVLPFSALLLIVAAVIGGLAYAVPLAPAAIAALVATLATGLATLANELRKDLREGAPLLAIAGTVAFLVFGSIWMFAPAPHPTAGGVALLGGAALLAFALFLAVRPARPDSRYELVARFGARLAETDGVQFAVVPGGAEAPPRRDTLEVWLQNTFAASRRVQVALSLPLGTALVVPPIAPLTLGPQEVGVLRVPVTARPGATGSTHLRVWLAARGGGRRVLPWRAPKAEKPPRGLFRWLGFLAALQHPLSAAEFLGLRGGVKVDLDRPPERSDVGSGARASFRRLPRGAGESSQIDERLLAERIVFLRLPIDDEIAAETIAGLRRLRERDAAAPLSLYIDSPGGSVAATLAVHDAMEALPMSVSTVCWGRAHGTAALLLAAGRRGHRFARPDAAVGLTPLVGGVDSTLGDEFVRRLAACTGQPASALEEAMAANATLGVEEARTLGFVDGLVARPSR